MENETTIDVQALQHELNCTKRALSENRKLHNVALLLTGKKNELEDEAASLIIEHGYMKALDIARRKKS